MGTRTYHDDVFQSAVWAVTLVRGPIIVTTTSVTRYRRASRTPATPSRSTENPPSGWLSSQPSPHATQSIYKLVGTRTYHDDVFQSAVWAVTLVRGPIIVTTTSVTRYRLASSTPTTPSSSTENPPSGWSATTPPSPTTTQGVYKLVGTRTYHDDVFQSAVWAVTLEQAPLPPVGPAVPSGLSITAVSTTVKGATTNLTSCTWSSVSGADRYSYQIENVTADESAVGSTPNTFIATSGLGISDGDKVRFRVRSHDTSAGTFSAWSGWVSTTVT